MGYPRLFPLQVKSSPNLAEVATDGSSYMAIMNMPAGGEVIRALFVNGTAASATQGTTTGSSASVVLYKNASNAASIIATFNGSGTDVATLGTATLLTSGTVGTANGRFTTGDTLIGEFLGGAASVVPAGAYIQVEYIYGREDQIQPSAASGPA